MYKYSLFEKICWLISLIITGFIVPGYAEVTLDGSLGAAGALPGPEYMIGAELGSRAGNNLFHSFGEFNINTGESATFTGPANIENIIGRVTGGHYSFIDGALNSKIPRADLYLLNPSGVMIGPNVQLNIDGAFHLSSTDYLQFADGQRFEANTKVPPLLTVAPPEAFGFLDKIGDIRIERGQLRNGDKDFSVTAGNLQIIGSVISSTTGSIEITSQAGNLQIINSGIGSTTLDKQAGDILLQAAGSIEIIGSAVVNQTLPGGSGHAGNVILNSPAVGLGENTLVGTRTLGAGDGGDVQITASQLITSNSSIFAETENTGSGGNITLQVGLMEIREGGKISTTSKGQGNSGNINVTATNSVAILGNSEQNQANTFLTADANAQGNGGKIMLSSPVLYIDAGLIQAATHDKGNAGDIRLKVDQLVLKNGAGINVSSRGSGASGNVEVVGLNNNKVDMIEIVGERRKQPSGIGSSAFNEGTGGTIRIAAHTLNLDQDGTIQTLTKGFGDAGDIKIDVNDLNITHGADIDASNEGNGYSKSGDIDIVATGKVFITAEPVTSEDTLRLNEKFVYNNHLGGIYSIAEKTGHGGNIKLTAGQLTLRDNGVISAKSTAYTGDGGNINISTNELYISGGEAWIDVSSEFGLNGEFILNSTKLTDDFLGLSPPQFQEARLTYNRCASMSRENLSRFLITIRDVPPPSPEDLRTHLYLPEM